LYGERWGGEVITTAKLGLGLRDLSTDLGTPSVAVFIGVDAFDFDVSFDGDCERMGEGSGTSGLKLARSRSECGI